MPDCFCQNPPSCPCSTTATATSSTPTRDDDTAPPCRAARSTPDLENVPCHAWTITAENVRRRLPPFKERRRMRFFVPVTRCIEKNFKLIIPPSPPGFWGTRRDGRQAWVVRRQAPAAGDERRAAAQGQLWKQRRPRRRGPPTCGPAASSAPSSSFAAATASPAARPTSPGATPRNPRTFFRSPWIPVQIT